jgi:site-specific recombinase XerD
MKPAGTFPALLEAFFVDRLMRQRQVSRHTLASYRDTFRDVRGTFQRKERPDLPMSTPTGLCPAVFAHDRGAIEQGRGNTARSRNVRLAAIHSFFRYVALHAPEHSALVSRVLPCQANVIFADQSIF